MHAALGVYALCDPFAGPDSPPGYPANPRVTAPSAAAAAPPPSHGRRTLSGRRSLLPGDPVVPRLRPRSEAEGFRGRLKRAVASTFPLRVWFFLKWGRRPLLSAWPTPCSRPFSSEVW